MRVFWDTNLFIYLWENSRTHARVESLAAWQDSAGAELVTSTLTIGELLVQPLKRRRHDIVEKYLAAFAQLHVVEFDRAAAYVFAELRAMNTALTPPDALQLACAATANVDLFVTNDRRLSRIKVSGVAAIRALADLDLV
jgi:predicted nucleic acid-binding protein